MFSASAPSVVYIRKLESSIASPLVVNVVIEGCNKYDVVKAET